DVREQDLDASFGTVNALLCPREEDVDPVACVDEARHAVDGVERHVDRAIGRAKLVRQSVGGSEREFKRRQLLAWVDVAGGDPSVQRCRIRERSDLELPPWDRPDLELRVVPDDAARRPFRNQILSDEYRYRGARAVEAVSIVVQVDEDDQSRNRRGADPDENRTAPGREEIV